MRDLISFDISALYTE